MVWKSNAKPNCMVLHTSVYEHCITKWTSWRTCTATCEFQELAPLHCGRARTTTTRLDEQEWTHTIPFIVTYMCMGHLLGYCHSSHIYAQVALHISSICFVGKGTRAVMPLGTHCRPSCCLQVAMHIHAYTDHPLMKLTYKAYLTSEDRAYWYASWLVSPQAVLSLLDIIILMSVVHTVPIAMVIYLLVTSTSTLSGWLLGDRKATTKSWEHES